MKIMGLEDNALFLSCWYERSRPVPLICMLTMIMGIMFLSFLSASMSASSPEAMWESLFHVVITIQAVVLILGGSFFASRMASRERTSETLDFHRNSPQPVVDKVIGLVAGSTCVEWFIFAVLFMVELPFALLASVTVKQIILFNVSLILSGIFFHTTAAMVSLLSKQKKGTSSLGYIFLFFWFGMPAVAYAMSSAASPFFAYLLGSAAFQYIFPDKAGHLAGRFYLFDCPLIILQALVQVPLVFLMFNGLKRIFSLPNSAAWSKKDVLCFCGFLFFMVVGFFVSNYIHMGETLANGVITKIYPHSFKALLQQEVPMFSGLFVMAGIVASFFCVPSYFKRAKYEVFIKNGVTRDKAVLDDGATSLVVMLLYVSLGIVFATPYLFVAGCSTFKGLAYVIILSSYVMAFAGFLEYFRLGRFRNNKIFFMTAMAVVWMFIPWVAALMLNFKLAGNISVASISPFFGVGYAVSLLLESKPVDMVGVVSPCLVAGLMWLLAYQEWVAVKKQVAGAIS
ncbi:MAG: hypothetical protein HQL17_00850 [Candidatus Omnitrophica bacterium]|nr:hypothetical protein [Candidatus Omnitrophota bacterium]